MNHLYCASTQHSTALRALQGLLVLTTLWHAPTPLANEATLANPVARSHPAASQPSATASASKSEAAPVISIKSSVAQQLRDTIDKSTAASGIRKKPVALVGDAEKKASADAHAPAEAPASKAQAIPAEAKEKTAPHRPSVKSAAGHAPGAAHGPNGAAHWSYEGETGPQAWGQLQSAFNICAIGKRQSPIHIEEASTLQGPAEPLQINYLASKSSVVNNGHTIQVDLESENTLTVRGSTYKLVQLHFHHPAEERVNYKGFAMVAHLVHKNAEGQLAVLAVLFDPGEASPMIQKIWTHMPLDAGDRVRLPDGLIDVNDTLPKDRRYYQFIGSLTTPPCTEGVLWLVLRQPMTVSREQLRLFAQLFPNNARPIQPSFGRVVREAQ